MAQNLFKKMERTKRFHRFLIFPLILLISGCAHVISKDLRTKTDPSLTFGQVQQGPNLYKGKSVVWGGEIIQTTNQKDDTTLMEVFQRALGWRGEPKETIASEGRFLVLIEKYLDPYLFRRGRKITVAGEIQGERMQPIGEMEYRYPLILSKQIYLWEEYVYPVPYYYYPYYYDLWWGYPYWRWGFGLHDYHYLNH
jgi:outer membrane lipoprotein